MKMTGILLALSLWGSVFAVCRIGRIRFWFAPVVAISGIGLFLFAGALAGKLPLFADLALAAGLVGSGCFAGCLLRKKTAFPGWTLPGVCIGALAVIFCLLTLRLKLTHYDNFSHWALIVKYLLLVEKLPGAESTMIPFRDYPPGVSLIIYYICRYAGHSQGMMLLAQNSVLFACFFALAGIVEEKRRFLLYSLLGAGCAMLFYLNLTIRINNLEVPPVPGAESSAWVYRHREGYRALFCRRGRCVCLLAAGAEGKRKRRAKISSVGISRTNSGSTGSRAGNGSFSGCALFAVGGSCPDRPGRV